MRIRLLHSLAINRRWLPAGEVVSVTDGLARQLVDAGHARDLEQATAAPEQSQSKKESSHARRT